MELFEEISQQADSLRTQTVSAAQSLRDFSRRLELILSQDHKNIAIRDTDFPTEFASFSMQLRTQTDQALQTLQDFRSALRDTKQYPQGPSSLQAKGFSLRAKTLSRACDDFTTAYDRFNFLYKNYTLAKLPVWVLTACCEDLNNLAGKILFLSREVSKKVNIK